MNYLGLNHEKTFEVAGDLNVLLANYHIYYQKLRNYHWNVEGVNFLDLHAKFEELYNDAKIKIDEVAERVLTLRHKPMSLMEDYLKVAEVEEHRTPMNDMEMVEDILHDHQILIKKMRRIIETADSISDEGTIDMIGGFLSDLEKSSWMLDAWKQIPRRNPTVYAALFPIKKRKWLNSHSFFPKQK